MNFSLTPRAKMIIEQSKKQNRSKIVSLSIELYDKLKKESVLDLPESLCSLISFYASKMSKSSLTLSEFVTTFIELVRLDSHQKKDDIINYIETLTHQEIAVFIEKILNSKL